MRFLTSLLTLLLLPALLTVTPSQATPAPAGCCGGAMGTAMELLDSCIGMTTGSEHQGCEPSGCDGQHSCCSSLVSATALMLISTAVASTTTVSAPEQRYLSIFLSLVDPPPRVV